MREFKDRYVNKKHEDINEEINRNEKMDKIIGDIISGSLILCRGFHYGVVYV